MVHHKEVEENQEDLAAEEKDLPDAAVQEDEAEEALEAEAVEVQVREVAKK